MASNSPKSYQNSEVGLKVALPKGGLMGKVSDIMNKVGFIVPGYDESSRVYRLMADRPEGVFVKVFSEKDIPVQVAVGNYDIGITGDDWISELTSKYRKIAIVKVLGLGFANDSLYAVSAPGEDIESMRKKSEEKIVTIVSEYPNIAENLARSSMFPSYRVLPVWGRATSYIPEGADIAIIRVRSEGAEAEIEKMSLLPILKIGESEATVIAHRESFETKDLSQILNFFRGES
jgi:ATP phosphoribosyltransferase